MLRVIQDLRFLNKHRTEFDTFLKTLQEGNRVLVFPPAVDKSLGQAVQSLFIWSIFTNLQLPGINETTIFSNADADYIVYPKDITQKAINQIPPPFYSYTLETFDCDDISEWGKLMLKQILVGCPVAYMEGYTETFGHAFCLIPCIDGYIWYNWDEASVRRCKRITFIRI